MTKQQPATNIPPAQASLDERLAAGHRRSTRIGLMYGIAAFSWWGLITIYFKAVKHVPPLEVLAHRVVWSALLLWLLLAAQRRIRPAMAVLANRRDLLALAGSTCLIACNWLVFIWAITHDQVTQASLGYFFNPLLSILLGYAFLGERLRPAQKISVLLAVMGVVFLTIRLGQAPTVALILPATFGLYGLVRKVLHMDAVIGLAIETLLLMPLAVGYLVMLRLQGQGSYGVISRQTDVLLLSAGLMTALPLLWFLNAARRLRLSTVGFLQYISPTLQLLLAVAVYHEAFTTTHALSFGLVWVGLAVYIGDALRHSMRT